jgi:hypothetical protein
MVNSSLLKDLGTDDHASFHEKGLSGMDPFWLVAFVDCDAALVPTKWSTSDSGTYGLELVSLTERVERCFANPVIQVGRESVKGSLAVDLILSPTV